MPYCTICGSSTHNREDEGYHGLPVDQMTPDGSMTLERALFDLEVAALDNMKVKLAQLRESVKVGDVSLELAVEFIEKFRTDLTAEVMLNHRALGCDGCGVIAGPHERFCRTNGPKKLRKHEMRDHTPVRIGMNVLDYDNVVGVVSDTPHNRQLLAEVDHKDGTCEAWWDIEYPNDNSRFPKQFDCSRLGRKIG